MHLSHMTAPSDLWGHPVQDKVIQGVGGVSLWAREASLSKKYRPRNERLAHLEATPGQLHTLSYRIPSYPDLTQFTGYGMQGSRF